jgi:hypothetical protein
MRAAFAACTAYSASPSYSDAAAKRAMSASPSTAVALLSLFAWALRCSCLLTLTMRPRPVLRPSQSTVSTNLHYGSLRRPVNLNLCLTNVTV